MSPVVLVLLCLAVFVATLGGVGWVRHLALRHALLDHPNERSSHADPTPRGAGVAVIPVLVAGWVAAIWLATPRSDVWMSIASLGLGLMAVSWIDDLRNLSARTRLLAHGAAVGLGLLALPAPHGYLGLDWPAGVDVPIAFLAWVWFVNLYNFMDGIDGLAGVETVGLGLGIAAVAMLGGAALPVALPWLTAAAAAGFLVWNWHPAKIFLGDSGSVPLGYLLGGLLLTLAAQGQWAAALILPAYYLADATLTLARRAARGETIWQAHREHAYQQAVRAGLSHAEVARLIGLGNLGLIGAAAWASRGGTVPGLITAGLITLALLTYLRTRKPS